MKKSILCLSSLLLMSPTVALSDMDIRDARTSFFERNKPKRIGQNYTYLEGNYTRSTLDANNVEETIQGGGLTISFRTYQDFATFIDLAGGAIIVNNAQVGTSDINLGVLYRHAYSKTTDFYTSIESNIVSYTDPTTQVSKNNNGYSFTLGVKYIVDEEIALDVNTALASLEDESFNKTQIKVLYGSDEGVQYVGGYEVSSRDDNLKTLSLGLRINYE